MLRRVGCDALVFIGERAAEPYVVACDYDEWRGTWASERRYADASEAWDDIDPDVIDGSTVRWRRSDFAEEIEKKAGSPRASLSTRRSSDRRQCGVGGSWLSSMEKNAWTMC